MKFKDKTVLLLGGTGTLSFDVMKVALEKGYKVSVLNRGNNNKKIPQDVEIILGDFKRKEELDVLFESRHYDIIVDFLSRTPQDIERIYPIFSNRCKQYIFVSSACVYRRDLCDFPIKENSPKPNVNWSYNIEKYECEKKIIQLNETFSSHYTIVRPYITYNAERIPFGIAPSYKYHRTIIERYLNGKPMFIWDGGNVLTTSTFTEEFAIGMVGLFLNPAAKNEDFHITSDTIYPIKEVLNKLGECLGIKPIIISVSTDEICKICPNYKAMLIGDRALPAIFNNTKIKKAVPELNFKMTLTDGIERIVKYYKELPTFEYDYQYDAQIDRLLKRKGIRCNYIEYRGAKGKKWLYMLYRYLPYNWARRFSHYLKIS